MTVFKTSLRAWVLAAVIGATCLPVHAAPAEEAAEVVFGVEPMFSARTLATAFQSVRNYMTERSGGSKVVVATAPNYDQFARQLLAGEFDMAFIGPHSSLLAAQKAGYEPLFKCDGNMKAVLIVEKASPYQKPADLRGKTVALPDHLTLGAMLGAEFFRPQPNQPPIDASFKFNEYSNSAALMLLRGDAAAAVVILQTLKVMSPDIQSSVRIIAESRPIPHMVIVAHPRLTADKRVRLRDALIEFTRITDPRRNIFVQSCKPGERFLSDQDVRTLAPYVEEFRRRLAQ